MKFSLVMATLGRRIELERLFDTLVAQTYTHFELIVIDQNDDDRVSSLVADYADRLEIVYLRSEKGLSRARNVGLRHITGDLVCFPDDDCWYLPDTLQQVAREFAAQPELSGLTGCSVDANGKLSQGRWAAEGLTVNRYNVWTCATSYTIFLRTEAVRRAGLFDERLGVGSGSIWGAGEEVNYLLGVLDAGLTVRYEPSLRIHHPEPIQVLDDKAFSRARLYNRGFGRVLGLNRYPAHFVLYLISRSIGGCVVATARFNFKRARYHCIAATQRFRGWTD
jgi:glycosyltransferase involved in cell wall biosynthesis